MQSISNISELTNSISEIKVITYSEENERINKIKHALGMLYFVALSVLTTTLFV